MRNRAESLRKPKNTCGIVRSEELFIQLQHSSMDCYFAKSAVWDKLAEYVTCLGQKELEELIGDPREKYAVAKGKGVRDHRQI